MSDPQKFVSAIEQVNHLGNARRADKIMIFLPMDKDSDPKVLLDLLLLKEMAFVANLLLILPTNSTESTDKCESYDIVTHKFVGADAQANDPLYLDSWDACTQQLKTNTNLLPHDISNLQGKTLKVATFTYQPYTIVDIDPAKTPAGYDGLELRVLTEFCRLVNCSVEIIRDDEYEWGVIHPNWTGRGILGNVVEDRADFGIGKSVQSLANLEQLPRYWTSSFSYVGYLLRARGPKDIFGLMSKAEDMKWWIVAGWQLPLMAFNWVMWLTVFFTFVYASLALYYVNGWSMEKVLLTTFGIMVTQSQSDPGSNWRVRSVTGWLLVTGLLIDNAYGGGLAAAFTVPKYQGSIDTVQDMIDTKLLWGATHPAWLFSILPSKDPKIKQLISQFETMDGKKIEKNLIAERMATLIEKLPAGYFAVCDYITREAVVHTQLMLEDIYYEYTVAMGRKSSQYLNKLTEVAGRFQAAGLLHAWETQVVLDHLDFNVQLGIKYSRAKKEAEVKSLDMDHVVGIFSLYLVGVAGSALLFLMEVLAGRRTKKTLRAFEFS
ncbi:hypothetical protein JYU34_016485 [Plutella xylostella]|uniref:Ionotropic glutamate receptor C-terminal domain-containing protein n=1 Tax=Plutella xylostella TaxID=51655 RepID=A0ABQ7Q2R2_PLUXY|nr:hypothetical protein JYU34_016485 [Plutella xylostella]